MQSIRERREKALKAEEEQRGQWIMAFRRGDPRADDKIKIHSVRISNLRRKLGMEQEDK